MKTRFSLRFLVFIGCFLSCSILPVASGAQALDEFLRIELGRLSRERFQQRQRQIPVFPKDKTVVNMTVKELLSYYPSELRRLEFSPNQDELTALLERIGERLQAFFRDFSNTSSKESIFMQKPGNSAGISREFSYLIAYEPGGTGPLLKEYRTDRKNRPIDQNAIKGFFVTSGYVGLSLNFHPEYQKTCLFRYLGKQTSDPHAYVIAFAQRLEAKDLQIEYMDVIAGKSARVPVQGIAWVNPDTYQILRLRINLLGAGNQSYMTEQSTDIKLGEVRFENSQKRVWLPREVVVNTQISGVVFRNQHRYTDYRLFEVTSDFTIDHPKPGAARP